MSSVLLGVVSDTHGYFDARLIEAFQGVDGIIHAGDVGSESVLEVLRKIAPVFAVHGNNDAPLGNLGLSEHADLWYGHVQIHVVHELPRARPPEGTRVIVFGHSHRQLVEWRSEILYINPGAAGRRGFHRLQTAALLSIDDGTLHAQPVILGEREARGARASYD